MPYEINSRKLFLTYPQCSLTKQEALALLQALFPIDEYVVAHELHASGDSHIHCYIKLGSAVNCHFRNAKFADIGGFHGNYQGARSVKNVLKYCTKQEDYISNIDVSTLLDSKSKRKAVYADLINRKRTLVDVIGDDPSMLPGYTKLKLDLTNYLKDQSQKIKDPIPDYLPNPWGLVLSTRVQGKKRHYWIYSDKPNLGKTYKFAKPLAEKYRCDLVTDFVYWSVTSDTRCIVLDEYNSAKLKWDELNRLADNTYGFRLFHQGILYIENYLVVILSNQSINTLYPFKNEFIYSRYNEIKLD